MRRVVYISTSLIGADEAMLASILAVSEARNDRCGVTGMLWWNDDSFAQVLEGRADAVAATMQRIQHDPRHMDVGMVDDRAITTRLFGHWGMIRADNNARNSAGTTYLIGFCAMQKTAAAQRLFNFLVDAGC